MPHQLYAQLSLLALLATCGLAMWKGAMAERAGAAMILGTWLVTLIASANAPHNALPAMVFLISDAVLAVGLLLLAIRYSSWWLGAAMLLQAIGLGVNAVYFAADKSEIHLPGMRLYVLGKNLASGAMLVVLLSATIASVIKRSRNKQAPPTPAVTA